jgi:hypothetical protein
VAAWRGGTDVLGVRIGGNADSRAPPGWKIVVA